MLLLAPTDQPQFQERSSNEDLSSAKCCYFKEATRFGPIPTFSVDLQNQKNYTDNASNVRRLIATKQFAMIKLTKSTTITVLILS